MFIVIVGCSEVGFFLSRALATTGHEVVVVEREPVRHQLLTENLGMVALLGDGADLDVLARAGVHRADAVIALTGQDATNLVVCQLARHLNEKTRTVTLVKDPKHERIFEELGIDMVVNWVSLALGALEAGVPGQPLRHLMTLHGASGELVSVTVPSSADIVGKRLSEIGMPPDSFVTLILRKETTIVPQGQIVIEADDEIVAVIPMGGEQILYDVLTGV